MHASFKALGWGGSGALRFMASRSASASAAATRTAAAAVGGVAVSRKWGPFKFGGIAAAMPAQSEATAGHLRGAKGFSSASTTGFQRNFHAGAVLRANFPIRGLSADLEQVNLGNLADNAGARKPPKRVGRGIGSGRGKTAGRGHKGQKSRSGNHGLGLHIGGATPLQKRLPKRGFSNRKHAFISRFDGFNLGRLMYFVSSGRLDTSQIITMKHLRDCGAVNPKVGVKLLADGVDKLDCKIMIEVSDASAKAKEIVEAAGGHVKIAYYNRLGLRAHLHPEKFERIPRRAAPPPRLLWKYPEHYKDVEAQFAARKADADANK